MRTMIRAGALALAIAATGLANTYGQVSATGNNPPFGSYVGHMGANTNPVEVRHNGNQHIQWYTDSIQRMQLYNSLPAGLIATDTADLSGFLALSGNPAFFNTERAFTRLHLADNHPAGVINAQQFGFRDWQRNGVTFTGNADHGYLGQKFGGRDTTDMVLLWSVRHRLRQPRSIAG